MQWLQRRNYLEAIFPLHNEEHLKSASPLRLVSSLRLQPFVKNCETILEIKLLCILSFMLETNQRKCMSSMVVDRNRTKDWIEEWKIFVMTFLVIWE